MITPQFEVKQTDELIIVIIRAPCVRLSADSEPEVHIDSYTLTFYASPYYLRLTFPGELLFDESVIPEFDGNTGSFTIRVPKAVTGEHFPDLDMLTKLLAVPHPQQAKRPLIEVLGEEDEKAEGDNKEDHDKEEGDDDDDDEWDFFIEQEPYMGDDDITLTGAKYGFANQRSGVLNRLQSELWEVFDIRDPDTTPESARRQLRIKDEVSHFNDEHYLADLYDDEVIQSLLVFEPQWVMERKDIKKGASPQSVVQLTKEENEILLKLPRKKHLLDSKETLSVMMSLVDILFAYAYNHRTTEGENTVASGWTVCKLSSTLSWFDIFCNLNDVVKSSFQRSLCFPLYRSWVLSEKVFSDVKDILAVGRRRILKCLLDLHQFLIDADQHYIMNDLYIADYCVWIQNISDSALDNLVEALNKIVVKKSDLNLDLEIVEQAGELAVAEAEGEGKGEKGVVTNKEQSDDSGSDTEDSDDDSSDDEDTDEDTDDEDSDDEESEDKGADESVDDKIHYPQKNDQDCSNNDHVEENILDKLKDIHISPPETAAS